MKQALLAILLITAGILGVAAPASAATVSLAVTGSVQCTQGKPVTGLWVNSSLGGSGWAGRLKGHDATVNYFRYPPAHGTVSLTVGTYISIHVGCGVTGTKWASDNWTANVVVHHPGHLIINAYSCQPPRWVSGQTVRGSCALPPQGTLGSATSNPFGTIASGAKGYCTCGASYMWFKNTGHYPAWTGNAIDWAPHASAIGWKVLPYPAEHALIVWPKTSTSAGHNHVGFVTSINVLTGILTFIDMNGGNHPDSQSRTELFGLYDSKSCPLSASTCTSARLGSVGNYLAGAHFIMANPGYDWSWVSGSYPATPSECIP
jgi:surface antigen